MSKVVNMPKVATEPKKLTAITFNLTKRQMQTLWFVMAQPANRHIGNDQNEACRILVVQALTQADQIRVAQELSQ